MKAKPVKTSCSSILPKLFRISAGVVIGIGLLWTLLFVMVRRPSWETWEPKALVAADPAALERHVRFLTENVVPRDADHPEHLKQAADYIHRAFSEHTARVSFQTFEVRGETYRNVSAFFGPPSGPGAGSQTGPRWVLGAHYDTFGLFGENPGADDNASGTAGLLELARLLGQAAPAVPVELVAFANEEPPNFASEGMGSAVHAESLRAAGIDVAAMVSLEMIGYFTAHQPWPNFLYDALYPDRGDFIALVGRWDERRLIDGFKKAMRAAELPVYSFNGPSNLPGLDASDHRSYWQQGYRAFMVTDTAFMRNPNYHTPGDTADTLDYQSMAKVVDGVLNAVLHLGAEGI